MSEELIAIPHEGVKPDEAGWLIEENIGNTMHWIALALDEWPKIKLRRARRDIDIAEYLTPVRRVKDASEAVRFARKEDAEAFIALFDPFLLHAFATEHCWPSAVGYEPSPQSPPVVSEGRVEVTQGPFREAFDLIFEAYNRPADAFHNYEAWAIWQHGKVIKAFGLMQKARTHRLASLTTARAEIARLREALERLSSDHTGKHIYAAGCDACHRQEIARAALGDQP